MKKNFFFFVVFILLIALILNIGCKKSNAVDDSSNGNSKLCFTAEFNWVILVQKFWSDGSPCRIDISYGVKSVTVTITRNDLGESHKCVFTNIKGSYSYITSFNVTIDGVPYSFPNDEC